MAGQKSDAEIVLYPHQRVGLHWLVERELAVGVNDMDFQGGILADDMGLGKTHQAVALVKNRSAVESRPTLIVAPTHLLAEWQKVCKAFKLSTYALRTENLARASVVLPSDVHVVLVGHTCFSRSELLAASPLVGPKFRRLIIDEAHICKNSNRFRDNIMKVTAEITWCLTGTPIVNSKKDVIALLTVITKDVVKARRVYENPMELHRVILKREKHILPDLPKLSSRRTFVNIRNVETYRQLYFAGKEMAKECVSDSDAETDIDEDDCGEEADDDSVSECADSAATLEYTASLADSRVFADEDVYALADSADSLDTKKRKRDVFDADAIIVSLLRMRQLCELDDAKIRRLVRDHRKHPSNTKALVFYTYTNSAAKAERALQAASDLEVCTMRYDGSIPPMERPRLVDDFNNATGNVTMFVQFDAGGTGLNLQAAQMVYLLAPHWNVCIEEQAICRTYRMKSANSVIAAKRYVARGTIEEWMSLRHTTQRRLMEQLKRYSEKNELTEKDGLQFFNDIRFQDFDM